MANKHTKTPSSSLVIGEIQIRTTVGYHHASMKIALKENCRYQVFEDVRITQTYKFPV